MHHSRDDRSDIIRHLAQQDQAKLDDFERRIRTGELKLGATGQFPEGKIHDSDEGEIRIAIAADCQQKKVVIDFGTTVKWLGFNAEQALSLADCLRAKAHEVMLADTKAPQRRKTVAVDLDGVLAHYEHWLGLDHIGNPLPRAVEFTRSLAEFADVLVYTTRCCEEMGRGVGKELLQKQVREWLDAHGFAYHDIWIGQGKPIAAAFVDDRNVAIPKNPSSEDFARAILAVRVLC